jgi:hypothetical protein
MASPDAPTAARRPWMVAAFVAFVVVLVVGAFLVGRSSDDDEPAAPATTAPSTETTPTTPLATTTTTTTTSSTTSTTAAPVVDTATAVWPTAASGVTYDEPVAAALGFADWVGFREPIAGPFLAGDSRSGEVEIRPDDSGPVTTVFVRQLSGGDDWYVLGSATADIEVATPSAGEGITSPVRLQGTSTAFEATVSVAVYHDGSPEPIGTGFVMGGSMGELGPFDGEVTFDQPGTGFGSLVLLTESMEDGATWEASVLRVRFP